MGRTTGPTAPTTFVAVPGAGDLAERRAAYRQLHDAGCFVLPNAWDIGSARYLEHLRFAAVATTSGGFAFSRGLPDAEGAIPLESMLAHVAEIADATDLPINADFESGYAPDPEAVAANVRRCLDAGASGLSIEDLSGHPERPLFDLALAVARVEAARAAIDHSGTGVVLTARAEPYVARAPEPLEEAVRRLEAYAAAGADVLYTPGPHDLASIRAIVDAVAPKPVNVLIGANVSFTVDDLAELGVRRMSVGSALARAAWAGFDRAARALVEGSFAGLDNAFSFAELNGFFSRHRQEGEATR
jgi:2-methylisocitrate lyase-like PEP mutase family enzyme